MGSVFWNLNKLSSEQQGFGHEMPVPFGRTAIQDAQRRVLVVHQAVFEQRSGGSAGKQPKLVTGHGTRSLAAVAPHRNKGAASRPVAPLQPSDLFLAHLNRPCRGFLEFDPAFDAVEAEIAVRNALPG